MQEQSEEQKKFKAFSTANHQHGQYFCIALSQNPHDCAKISSHNILSLQRQNIIITAFNPPFLLRELIFPMAKLRKFILRTLAINVGFFAAMAAALLIAGRGDTDAKQYLDALEDDDTKKKVLSKLKLQAKAASKPSAGTGTVNKHGLPQGQIPAKSWIVLDLGKRPAEGTYDLSGNGSRWSLEVVLEGAEKGVSVTLDELTKEGLEKFDNSTWHCVTGWSKKGLNFTGLAFERFVGLVERKCKAAGVEYDDDWQFLHQESPEGYEVPVFRSDAQDSFLCVYVDDKLVGMDHGGKSFASE